MSTLKTKELLKALSSKEEDLVRKQEIENLIKELENAERDDAKDTPSGKIPKKTARKVTEVIGDIFVKLGVNVAAREIVEHLHNLF